MTYDPMQYAKARADVAGGVAKGINDSIVSVAQKIPEIVKQKNIETKVLGAYIDTINGFADKVQEVDPSITREKAMIAGTRFYRRPIEELSPEANLNMLLNGDVKADKYIDDLKVKKFRREKSGRISTEGPAGTSYQPPDQPQVDIAKGMPAPIPGTTTSSESYTEGPQSVQAMQRSVENEMLRQPRTEVPKTSEDMYAEGQRLGITETPEFKSDYQRQQDIEAGMMYKPKQTRGEYLSQGAASGLDITQGAAGKLGGTLMTEKDIATNKRLEETARQREKYQTERNRIAGWRAAISQNKLTSDERLKIMNAKANNETDRLGLEIKIKNLETDLRNKANKTDPMTFQPMMTPEQVDASMEEIRQLRTNLSILEDFRSEYDGLIKEKGGIKPVAPEQPTSSTGIPKFNSPSDPGFQRLPSGSKFIDSNGVTRVKK